MEIPIMADGAYQVAREWLTKYDPDAFKDFEKELSQDGFTFIAFVNNRLKTCPRCLGDCGGANPAPSNCPMRDEDLLNICQHNDIP